MMSALPIFQTLHSVDRNIFGSVIQCLDIINILEYDRGSMHLWKERNGSRIIIQRPISLYQRLPLFHRKTN